MKLVVIAAMVYFYFYFYFYARVISKSDLCCKN